MHLLKSKNLTVALDPRWPRIAWYASPDGRTRIPGEREAVGSRVYIFRQADRKELISDDDAIQIDYTFSGGGKAAVWHASLTCDGQAAVDFDIAVRVSGPDALLYIENVVEHAGYFLLAVRFQRMVAANSADGDGRVITCFQQGRLLDPAKCKPNMIDYNWHGSTARPCGAAYRSRFMVTIDIPGWENLFINEVRQYSRIGRRETIASIGTELMYRRRVVEDPRLKLQVPAGKTVPVEVPDVPIPSAEPRMVRLHAIAATKKQPLDWTDAAKYFQSLLDPALKPRPLYDNTIVGKCCFAQFREPLLSLEQGLELIRKIYHLTDGMRHVCYFTCHQHEGGDSGRPDVLTIYGAIGDKKRLRAIIQEARAKYNAIVSFHDNQSQADVAWKDFNWDIVARDPLGRPFAGGVWGGVQLAQTSMPAYLPTLKKVIPKVLREYGIRDTYHLDTIGMQWICDTHPRRRYNATRCHDADFELLKEYNRHGVDVTGEILVDPYVGKLGHVWALFNYGTTFEGEEKVPFGNFIYHGATSWNAGHAEIPLAYFSEKPGPVDTILGLLIQGGGIGLTLRGGRGDEYMPNMAEMGHDGNMAEMTDLLYLVQPVYHALRNLKWTDYRQDGSIHRVECGRGNYIQIDHAEESYEVVVDGKVMARDFTTVFAGPRKGTLLAYSRKDYELDWPAPAGWKNGEVRATILTESGPGVTIPARIEKGRLKMALRARQPVRLEKV